MMKSSYPFYRTSAILLTILLSSCGGSKKSTLHFEQQQSIAKEQAITAQVAKAQLRIDQLVAQARLENPRMFALQELLTLSHNEHLPKPAQGQAALQYVELLFEFGLADAFTFAETTLHQWHNHAYAPHTYLILGQQWLLVGNKESAINALTSALTQPQVDPYIVADIVKIAQPLLRSVSENSSVYWMLAAANHDHKNKDMWLQQAAKLSTLEYLLELRRSASASISVPADYYRYMARERLMVGDYHAVRVISKILEMDMPDSEAAAIVQQWAESEGELNIVGVLLPLTGKYAAYGKQALQGIRLAMSQDEFEGNIVLRIHDTGGQTEQTIAAYHQLLTQGTQWVIGPLLSTNTAALLPYLIDDLPVISLSNQVQLASQSPVLFIHNLAKTIHANFMAHYAIKKGHHRIAIIHDAQQSPQEEAAAFAQTFINEGGEIIHNLELKPGIYDYRPDLRNMRSHTDSEEELSALEEELFLFSPELKMDIKLPLNMDAIYIVTTGKRLAVLAGQMAYAGMSNIQLYGSQRWFDGHLMDDKGRYLSGAQFSTPFMSLAQPNQAILDVQNQYRVTWDTDENINPLFALAYDVAMNIASLGIRLGIQGKEAIETLLHAGEFPAISGNYYFDEHGVSQKSFAVQTIRRGRIEILQTIP